MISRIETESRYRTLVDHGDQLMVRGEPLRAAKEYREAQRLKDTPLVRTRIQEAGRLSGGVAAAVAGEQGVILRFEMQATKGHGRIVPLGSIQRVMRESIEAPAQYIRAHCKELDIAADWHESFDVALLATIPHPALTQP